MKGKEIIVTFSEPWYEDQMDLIYHPLTKELFTKISGKIYRFYTGETDLELHLYTAGQ